MRYLEGNEEAGWMWRKVLDLASITADQDSQGQRSRMDG